MAEAKRRDRWAHTSALLAMLANCHRNPKKPPRKPSDFDPYELAKKRTPVAKSDGFKMLKAVFVDRGEVNRKGAKDAKVRRRREE